MSTRLLNDAEHAVHLVVWPGSEERLVVGPAPAPLPKSIPHEPVDDDRSALVSRSGPWNVSGPGRSHGMR